MLANNLTLDDVSGDDVVYNLIAPNAVGEVIRIDPSKSLTEPRRLKIRHSTQGKGIAVADRHNILFEEVVKDATGAPWTGSVSITLTHPRNGAITAQHMKDLVANAISLLTNRQTATLTDTSNLDAVMRGES